MNTVQRIAKNFLVLSIAQVVNGLFNFLLMMYIARYLGAEGFGVLSFAIAFSTIFMILTDFGLQQLTIREVARDKSLTSKYLGNITVIKLILVTVTFGLIALTINLLGYPQQTEVVVYLIGLSLAFNTFTVMFQSIFRAYERIEFVSAGIILESLFLFGGTLFGISHDFSIIGFGLVFLAARVVSLVFSFTIGLWKFVVPRLAIDFKFWKTTFKESWPFGAAIIFVTICFYIDTVMLSLMKGDTVVGWYNAAYRMVYALIFIPGAYFASVYPVMSRFAMTSAERVRIMYERSSKYMLILAVPIATVTTLLADRIIQLVYGDGYTSSVIALQILVWAVFFAFIGHAPLWTLNATNKQKVVAGVASLCVVFNIALNLILIPYFSYEGASIATVATEFLGFALLFGYVARIFSNPFSLRLTVKIVLANSIIAVLVVYCGEGMNIWLEIFSVAVIYLLLLTLFRVFSNEDISMLRRLVSRLGKQK